METRDRSGRDRVLSAALESLSTAIVLVDSGQRIRYANAAALALVGGEVSALSGQPFMRGFRIRGRSFAPIAESPAGVEPPEDRYYELKCGEVWRPIRYQRRTLTAGLDIVEMHDAHEDWAREERLRAHLALVAG